MPSVTLAETTRAKKWLLRLAKLTVVLLVAGGVAATIHQTGRELLETGATIRPAWLLATGGFYLLSILPAGLYWHAILRALDQHPRLIDSLGAYYIGHLGKYVPGKALVVVLRAWLIKRVRVDPGIAAASVVLETLTMMAVGAFWAASILWVIAPEQKALVWLAAVLMVAAGIPTLPPLFRRLAKLLPRSATNPLLPSVFERFGTRLMLTGWLGNSFGWCLMGMSLWSTLAALGVGARAAESLPLCTAAVALAVVAGFLSGIPGGALVREGALWLVLAEWITQPVALLAALLLRLVWILSELAISSVFYLLIRNPGAAARTIGMSGGVWLLSGAIGSLLA